MKKITITTLSAILLSAVGAHAQVYTKPTGYVTHTLKAGKFNLVGLTVHEPILVSGDFETVSATELTDTSSSIDFGSLFEDGKTYIFEIVDGNILGTSQEFVWDATETNNTITTTYDFVTDGLASGDGYQIRAASTLEDLFGADNSVGLEAAASSAASAIVWIQDAASTTGFSRYYYNTGGFGTAAAWKNITTAGEVTVLASDIVLPYIDAVFIQMPSGSDSEIVFSGSVKTTASTVALDETFNYVSTTFPVGSTIQNSGLINSLSTGASSAASDIIWIPQADGSYNRYYYNTGGFGVAAEWKLIVSSSVENTAPDDVELTSGIIIQKNGADVNSTITPAYNL